MEARAGTPSIRVETVEPQSPQHGTPGTAKSLPPEPREPLTPEVTRPKTTTVVEFPTSTPSPSSSVPPSPSTSTSSNPQHAIAPQQLSPVPRKISTFRRLTPRPSAPSSPLAGVTRQVSATHSRGVSTASLPPQSAPRAPEPSRPSPPLTNGHASDRPTAPSTPSVPATSPHPVEKDLPVTPRGTVAQLEEIRPSKSQTSTLSKSTSQGSSQHNEVHRSFTSSPYQKPKSAPYRPGFQPKGVYRPLTDEFLAARRLKREAEGDAGRLKRIEHAKLERRFEKLVNLHFPEPGSEEEKDQQSKPEPKTMTRRASSFFDFDSIRTKKFSDAGDLWRGVVTGNQDKARDVRGQYLFLQSIIGLTPSYSC